MAEWEDNWRTNNELSCYICLRLFIPEGYERKWTPTTLVANVFETFHLYAYSQYCQDLLPWRVSGQLICVVIRPALNFLLSRTLTTLTL